MAQASDAANVAARRRGPTVGDLLRSLSVVLVLVGVIYAVNRAQEPPAIRPAVDYPAALTGAQQQVDYELAGPRPLPPGWRATSARTEEAGNATTWHLGMVTSSERYAAVEQSDGPRDELLRRHVAGAQHVGTVRIGSRTWDRMAGGDPNPRALMASDGAVTTLIAGTATWPELRRLASATAD